MQAVLTKSEAVAFLDNVFPQIRGLFELDDVRDGAVSMRLSPKDEHLRPGNTVSGPTMFGLVDVAAYVAVLTHVGREALAVTTHCSIDFMNKPAADEDIIAVATLLKLGRSLAIIDVKLYAQGRDRILAAANVTYSIPPKKVD